MEEIPLIDVEPSTIAHSNHRDTLVSVPADNGIPPANTTIQSGVPAISGLAPTGAAANETAPQKVRITDCTAMQAVCSVGIILVLLPLNPFTAGTVIFDDWAVIGQHIVRWIFRSAKKKAAARDSNQVRAAAAGKRRCPTAKSGSSIRTLCAYIVTPSLMLLPLTAGAFIWGPGIMSGHIILYLAMRSPCGDAYRTTSIDSSYIVGSVGGAAIATVILICMVASGLMVGTCLAVYRKLRGRSTSPSKVFAHFRATQTKSTTVMYDTAIRLALMPAVGCCGARLLHSIWNDYQTLDDSHLVLAAVCSQLVSIITLFWSFLRRRYNLNAAKPTSDIVDSEDGGTDMLFEGVMQTEDAGKDMVSRDFPDNV